MKTMYFFYVFVFLFCIQNSLQAQETISVAGGNGEGVGGTSAYTIGQVAYITNKAFSNSEAQGVQQAYEISVVTGIERPDLKIELMAFPNPTVNNLNLIVGSNDLQGLQYQLCENGGRLIGTGRLKSTKTQISMINLMASTYYLKIVKDSQLVKVFKIVKL